MITQYPSTILPQTQGMHSYYRVAPHCCRTLSPPTRSYRRQTHSSNYNGMVRRGISRQTTALAKYGGRCVNIYLLDCILVGTGVVILAGGKATSKLTRKLRKRASEQNEWAWFLLARPKYVHEQSRGTVSWHDPRFHGYLRREMSRTEGLVKRYGQWGASDQRCHNIHYHRSTGSCRCSNCSTSSLPVSRINRFGTRAVRTATRTTARRRLALETVRRRDCQASEEAIGRLS